MTYLQDRDEEHLGLLAIFYYVMGVLNCIGVIVGLLFVGMGGLAGFIGLAEGDGEALAVGGMFFVIGIFVSLLVAIIGGLVIYTGRCLKQHKHYMFCLIMAALMCTNAPLGTALGVFTFIVLLKPEVQAKFGRI